MLPVTDAACPLCGGRDSRAWFRKSGHVVCRCAACGLAFAAGDWPTRQAQTFYGADYFAGHNAAGYTNYAGLERALRVTAEGRLRRLPRGGRLLDLGCGPGVFADAARSRFRVCGSDVSAAGCATARARGLDVTVNDATALPFADASFDVVTMWDTVEHLAAPRAALQEVSRVLRAGGVLTLSTGDIASWCARLSGRHWHLYTLPEHRTFFSLATLDPLLAGAGLQRRNVTHGGAYYSVAYLLERLAKSLGVSTRRVDSLLRHPWLNRLTLYVNLFDIITVEAVKAPT